MEPYLRQGLISDSKVLDIRQVDVCSQPYFASHQTHHLQIHDAKILENNVPVFILQFATQEVLLFRNAKTKEIVVGSETKVEQCNYVAVITRIEEALGNELTGGWKVVEVRILSLVAVLPLNFFLRWLGGVLKHIYNLIPGFSCHSRAIRAITTHYTVTPLSHV